jgi:hypothetical protein
MTQLIETESAPFKLLQCPNCLVFYAGRGLQLQTCPNCDSAPIASLDYQSSLSMCDPYDHYCTKCHTFRPFGDYSINCHLHGLDHALNHLQPGE